MRIPTSGYQPTDNATPRYPSAEPAGASSTNPITYEGIVFSRELGRGVAINAAPRHTKISIEILTAPTVHIRETVPGYLLFADQVEYVITGYDPADATLTLDLIKDYRPGSEPTP